MSLEYVIPLGTTRLMRFCAFVCRFYEVNDINQFALSRPFHKGKKDKECEFKVSSFCVSRDLISLNYVLSELS